LRNVLSRKARLVIEDAPKVLLVRKNLVLAGKKRATRIYEVNTRQLILFGDFLRAQVFLDCNRIVRPTLHGRVIGDDHALHAMNAPNSGNESSCRNVVIVQLVRSLPADLKKLRVLIQQQLDSVARQQFAAQQVFFTGSRRTSHEYLLIERTQILDHGHDGLAIVFKIGRSTIDFCFQYWHRISLVAICLR